MVETGLFGYRLTTFTKMIDKYNGVNNNSVGKTSALWKFRFSTEISSRESGLISILSTRLLCFVLTEDL